MKQLPSKIALISNASYGQGRAIALELARLGADAIVTFRDRAEEGHAVAIEIEALGRKAVALPFRAACTHDFALFAKEVRQALHSQWGRHDFDFLVHATELDPATPFEDMDEADFHHFKGIYFLTQTLLPLLTDSGGIACASALASHRREETTGAVEVFMRYLTRELGPRRIRAKVKGSTEGVAAFFSAAGHLPCYRVAVA